MEELSRWHPTSESGRFFELRREMVELQLRRRGIGDARVLAVMGEVLREEFVPSGLRNAAYDDDALPIGFGQTISQPYTVASMLEALQLSGKENALEVGTGSGYTAAVLSRLVRVVHSVERVAELAQQAKERLDRLGYANIFVHVADGTLGLADEAPFDAIVVTAGAARLPQPYEQQLAEGGDSGQVGRGNRVNGLISLCRPMTLEAAAGKNPVSHVGKVYNLLAQQIAETIHDSLDAVTEAQVWLCSQIGQPLNRPWYASAQVALTDGAVPDDVSEPIREIIRREIAGVEALTKRLVRGELHVC